MKRWVTLAVAGSMLLAAGCGSSDSDKDEIKGMSQEQACGDVQKIQTDGQKLTEDVAAGKVDMTKMMNEMSGLAGRLLAVSGSVEPGQLQDALQGWAKAMSTQLTDPSEANQTATFDARDKVDDICGIPHGPRA